VDESTLSKRLLWSTSGGLALSVQGQLNITWSEHLSVEREVDLGVRCSSPLLAQFADSRPLQARPYDRSLHTAQARTSNVDVQSALDSTSFTSQQRTHSGFLRSEQVAPSLQEQLAYRAIQRERQPGSALVTFLNTQPYQLPQPPQTPAGVAIMDSGRNQMSNVVILGESSSESDDLIQRPRKKKPAQKPVQKPVQNLSYESVSESTNRLVKRRRITNFPAPLDLVNGVDDTELPVDFTLIDDYVFKGDIRRIPKEFVTGCTCRKENGRSIGCEYVQKCECLDDMPTDRTGKRIGFAYGGIDGRAGCLQAKYLKTRYPIYECSSLCNCPAFCRNKVVQNGRKLPLEIFRTKGRGWGELKRGDQP